MRRVDDYFEETGLSKGGGARMWLKTLVLVTWFVASYALLVFWAGPVWQAALCTVSLGLAMAGIGYCVMHDGNDGRQACRHALQDSRDSIAAIPKTINLSAC